MTPDTSFSSSKLQRKTRLRLPRTSNVPAGSQRTFCWIPPWKTACSTLLADGAPDGAAVSFPPPQPAASPTIASASAPLRCARMRALLALTIAAVTLAIVPSGGASSSQTVADFWTGTWPAFLMENGEITDPLGTLRWRQIRYEEGVAMVGHVFGGKVFEGCSTTDPSTLFFRGSYVEGGDLIACTTSADGKTIVGRFNGREDFMSGSFSVSIIRDDDKRVFAGKYFEDQGITTDWCGSLQLLTKGPSPVLDMAPPRVTTLGWSGKAGAAVPLRARVRDNALAPATLSFSVRRQGRTFKAATIFAKVDGSLATTMWRAPKGLRGTFSVCATAIDAAGNESARSCATIRLR
jgi:hypothetical protein